jgi:hypothetical protein
MRFIPAPSRRMYPILGLALAFTLQACAHRPLVIPATAAATEAIDSLLVHLATQDHRVATLFCSGKLTSKSGQSELETTVSIVGRRIPFETRIEFANPWGAPIAYLVMDTDRFKFLVFGDKRLYVGSTDQTGLLRYFPFLPDPDAIWGFIRGYPVIAAHGRASSQGDETVTIFDRQGGVLQRLVIDLKTRRPKACFYPGKKLTLSYGDFAEEGGVDFARSVDLRSEKRKRTLILHIRQAVFNPPLPRSIFDLKRPEGFKVIDLSETPNTPDRR